MVQRVFVIWTHPLFQESVRLILKHPSIEWLGSTSDYATARDQIIRLQPDAIFVEEEQGSDPALGLAVLEACSWDVYVISLNLNDNHLFVYHREDRIMAQAEDLLHLIQIV